MQPRLTIGFATFQDYYGAWPTIQSLRLYHADVMSQCELVVVDQTTPSHRHAKDLKTLVEGWVRGDMARPPRYISMQTPKGTAPPRQRVFEEATAPYVLCIDGHVLLAPGSIRALLDYYEEHPETPDLIHGPMLYDDLTGFASHMEPVWRSEMFGIWGHDPYFADPTAEPRPIAMHGLGLFSARKEVWMDLGGFHKDFRGFGGEEGYIHEKFRQAGGQVLCHPAVRWVHRFGRPDGVPYPLTRQDKVRNYILGWNEIGWSLDSLRQHFCQEIDNPMSEEEFENIRIHVEEGRYPIRPVKRKWATAQVVAAESGCNSCNKSNRPQPDAQANLDEIFRWAVQTPRDLNEHLTTLREYASRCESVTEFTMRRESTVAFAAARPKRLHSYNLERDPLLERVSNLALAEEPVQEILIQPADSLEVEIEETDLLFIDTIHNAERLWAEMEKHAPRVRRYLILHDTTLYGEKGEGETIQTPQGPVQPAGLLPALRRFVKEHPEWSVIYHTDRQYGLTILSRDPRDKPPLPSLPTMAWNYAKAYAKHKAQGSQIAEESLVQLRLDTCALCPLRSANRCTKCGCYLDQREDGEPGKAVWKESECPFGFWSQSQQQGSPVMPLVLETKEAT